MKKIFTLLTMALLAIGAQAQTITFTEAKAAGTLDGVTFGTGLVLTVTDKTDGGKLSIDANQQYFGTVASPQKYEYRLKTGGKSDSKNALKLTTPSAGKLTIAMRSSSSGAARTVTFKQGDSEIATFSVSDDNKTVGPVAGEEGEKNIFTYYTIESVPAGDINITYNNGTNFYAFIFEAAEGPQAVDVAFSLTKDEIYSDETSQIVIKGKSGLDGLTMNDLTYDNSIINIDATGKITPVAAGTSNITFTTAAVDGKYNAGSASLSITVKEREIPEEIDFPASTAGISCKGTTEYSSEAVKVKKTNVPGYKFNNSGIDNAIVLTVKDGFKVGDVVTIAGVLYSGNATKSAVIQLFQAEDGEKVWETEDLSEVKNNDTAEATEGSYTLEAASDKLYLVRNSGSTGSAASCFAVKIQVTRGTETGIVELPVTIENNNVIYNLSGQRVDENYRGVVIKNGKKVVIK